MFRLPAQRLPFRGPPATAVRCGMLALAVLAQLPMPVGHRHDADGLDGHLAEHLAAFHGGRGAGDHAEEGWHVHLVPAAFWRFGGATAATGTDGPSEGPQPPEVSAPPAPQLADAVAAPAWTLAIECGPAIDLPSRGDAPGPHFLQTFDAEGDLSCLIGVALC